MKLLVFLFCTVAFACQAQVPFFPQLDVNAQRWHYVDVSGKTVLRISIPVISLRPFSDGLAAAQDSATAHWGFIDASGKWVVQPKYDRVHDFIDGYAIAGRECTKNCNQNREGLLGSEISEIIDRKGKVLFTDNSQDENPSTRFFLDENLGAGLFRVTMGYGFNDMKNIIDLKGKFLCETYSVFGNMGNIVYEKDLKAYRCANKFYKHSGELVLDLSTRYFFVYPFSEGYAWANTEEVVGEEDFVTWNILVDTRGKEILKLNNAEYSWPEAVENGAFQYMNPNGEIWSYNLQTGKTAPFQLVAIDSPVEIFPGIKLSNGCRLAYTSESQEELTGFVSPEGQVFFLITSGEE